MYTCPMHPEIVSDKGGKCPKCGMNLVLKNAPEVHQSVDNGLRVLTWKSYMPIIAILKVLLLTSIVISINDAKLGVFSLEKTISYFMIGFFLTFATFKLM